jgi:hypothetical protein
MVVLSDRTQAAASLADGEIEILVHRRLTKDDGRGVGEPLSEPGADGKGLIVSGITTVVLGPTAGAAAAARFGQNAIFAPYHVSLAPMESEIKDYVASHSTALTFLKTDLPSNIELITMQIWDHNQVLLRLAHSFGVNEDPLLSLPAKLDLASLFVQTVTDAQELQLSAAVARRSSSKYKWNTGSNDVADVVKRESILTDGTVVSIGPLEVRTFLVSLHQS